MELSVGAIKTFICLHVQKYEKVGVLKIVRLYYLSLPQFLAFLNFFFHLARSLFHNLPWIAFVKNAKRAGVFPSLSHQSRGGLSTLYSRMISLFLSSRGSKFLGAVETSCSCISFGNLDLEFSREIRSPHFITTQTLEQSRTTMDHNKVLSTQYPSEPDGSLCVHIDTTHNSSSVVNLSRTRNAQGNGTGQKGKVGSHAYTVTYWMFLGHCLLLFDRSPGLYKCTHRRTNIHRELFAVSPTDTSPLQCFHLTLRWIHL